MQTAGLYIHIPFCQRKCGYCDFYSITRMEQMDDFVEALLQEIQLRGGEFHHLKFRTIFLGGGTPSLLPPQTVERIWTAIYRTFNIADRGEFTLEANPGTLTVENLQAYRRLGFNRLSLGVQSFQEADLKFLGRIHSVEDIYQSFEWARKAGFENINLDLMTAFPGLTLAAFKDSLEKTLKLQPEHISCYTLIFEPGTPFYRRMRRGELQPLSEDQEATFYELAREKLEGAGYQQYEVSNFARTPDLRCRHNLIYWTHRPYLGLGPSAHSFYPNRRWANVRSLSRYIAALRDGNLPVKFEELLTEEQLQTEYIYLNLRLKEGISIQDFERRFHKNFHSAYSRQVEQLLENRYLEQVDDRLRLTASGWLLADVIASYF